MARMLQIILRVLVNEALKTLKWHKRYDIALGTPRRGRFRKHYNIKLKASNYGENMIPLVMHTSRNKGRGSVELKISSCFTRPFVALLENKIKMWGRCNKFDGLYERYVRHVPNGEAAAFCRVRRGSTLLLGGRRERETEGGRGRAKGEGRGDDRGAWGREEVKGRQTTPHWRSPELLAFKRKPRIK